jgi:hypothetical protein
VKKIMFLASKLWKLKTQFCSQKYHDINNKLRDYMNLESIPTENLKTRYIQADLNHNPEQNLHPQVSGQEQRRQIRMDERYVNRRNNVESDMRKLFKKLPMFIYKDIRNQYNDSFEREQFEKKGDSLYLDLKNIQHYTPNPQ